MDKASICSSQTCCIIIIGAARVGPRGPLPPKFLAYLVILCFWRRCPKQTIVARLKVKIFGPPQILGWLGQWSLYRFIVIRYTVCCRFLSEHCWTRPIIVEKESVPTVCQERRKVYLKLWSNSIMFNRGSKNLSLRCQWFLMCAFSCLNCIFIVK